MRATAAVSQGVDPILSVGRSLTSMLFTQRARVAVVAFLVLAAAAFELAPPLIVRAIVDGHLLAKRPDGVWPLAVLYLLAVAAMQAMTFLYGYLAATGAQALLSDLRTRLFAHLVRLPTRFFDRTPGGDVISRCT